MSEFGPAGRRSFLGVDRSVSGRRWDDRLDPAASLAATAMVQRHELPELLARVLAARGVTVDAAAEFLEPSLRRLMPDFSASAVCAKPALARSRLRLPATWARTSPPS